VANLLEPECHDENDLRRSTRSTRGACLTAPGLLVNEELIVVLSGRPTLRTADGTRDLAVGEDGVLAAFRRSDAVAPMEGESE